VAKKVVMAVQSGSPFRALKVFLKRKLPLWSAATITSMATRANAPDWLLEFSLRCFDFYLFLLAAYFGPSGPVSQEKLTLQQDPL